MDDIALITACRPEPEPATAAERAQVEEQLMSLLEPARLEPARLEPALLEPALPAPDSETTEPAVTTDPALVALTSLRGNRRRRRVAMVAVAATVAAVVAVAGLTLRGPGPLATPMAAADQLRAIADRAASTSPFPSAPYVIESRRESGGPRDPSSLTVYALGDGDTINTASPCSPDWPLCDRVSGVDGPPPPIPLGGSAAEIRANAERWIAEQSVRQGLPNDRGSLIGELIRMTFPEPSTSTEARAELLRLLAGTDGVQVEPGVANTFGRTGTQFTVTVDGKRSQLLIDPLDGYLLGLRFGPQDPGPLGPPVDSVEAWDRPLADPPLPAPVAQLAADLADRHDAIEAGVPDGRCVLATHPPGSPINSLAFPDRDPNEPRAPQLLPSLDGNTFGVTLPEGLAFTHCW